MAQRTCSVDGCERPHDSRGWCKKHYNRWAEHGDAYAVVRVHREKYTSLKRDDAGRKHCQPCDRWLTLDQFASHKTTSDGLSHVCRKCMHIKTVERKYALPRARFTQMLEEQGDACLLCRARFDDAARRPHIDHDHACCSGDRSCGRCVRGVLCSNCNTALGLFKDNPVLLRAATDYLERSA